MRDRRQTDRIRSEHGATTALMLVIALLLIMLAGMAARGMRPMEDGASAQVIAADGLATEGSLVGAAGFGSTSRSTAMIQAGSPKTVTLQGGDAQLYRASEDTLGETLFAADEGSDTESSGEQGDDGGQEEPVQDSEPSRESDPADQGPTDTSQSDQDDNQPSQADQADQAGQAEQADDTAQAGGADQGSKNDQPAQNQANETTDTHSQTDQQKSDDTAQKGERTLTKTLSCVNGTSYKVTLTFDEKANIPSNAQLKLVELNRSLTEKEKKDKANKDRPFENERFVSQSALNKRGEMLDNALKLTSTDYRYFTKYMDIMLVADGQTVVPDTPVKVTIETKVVTPDKAATLEMALKEEVDKPTKKIPYAYKPLGGTNETKEKDTASTLTFTTDKLGEFALAGVAYSMGTWDVDGTKVTVMGPRGLKTAQKSGISVDTGDEGLELREAFTIKLNPSPSYGTALWIAARPTANAQTNNKEGGLYGYRVYKGMMADRLFEPKGTAKPVEFSGDTEGIALVWDTGYRKQSLTMRKVTLDGMLPEGVSAKAKYVQQSYNDHASISKKLAKAAQDKGAALNTVAAYDISMSADGTEYRPSNDKPVKVSISSIYIRDNGLYQVWHVRDDNSVELVEDAAFEGDTVTFEATDLNVFMVVETTIETTLQTDDGKSYRVSVTYDNTTGIPEEAALEVAEIKQGQKGYKGYVNKAAKALGEKAADLTLARAFDITLQDPKTGKSYQPSGNVRVSIELLDGSMDGYNRVRVVHIPDASDAAGEVMDSTVVGDGVEFATKGFSVYVVTGYTVDFHWGDYIYHMAGASDITLSALLKQLGVTEIALADVADVTFSNPDYVEIERLDADWLLRSRAPFDTEEVLTLTLANGQGVEIKVTDEGEVAYDHNPKVTITAGDYDAGHRSIDYTVTVEAEGDLYYDGLDHPVTIEDLTSDATSALVLDSSSATYAYAHAEGFAPEEGAPASAVNGEEIGQNTEGTFAMFPVTVSNMYDGDKLTLHYTAVVSDATYDASQDKVTVQNTATITGANAHDDPGDNTASVSTSFAYTSLLKELTGLEGSWATWRIKVNPRGFHLNGGEPLTLKDNFNPNQGIEAQSIDYASISVTDGVSYDYRSSTGTFVIPDATYVTITYRTRIKAQPGEVVEYGNVATLLDANNETIAEASVSRDDTIYPSASDVASTTGVYMVKLFVYANAAMQDGLSGAQFVLLDANGRPISYKTGDHAGEDVSFITGEDGYADIQLDGSDGGVSIRKNTAYYLEMIKAPEGYKKDNTLYSFMITDDPSYNSGGAWTYYNGDTMKVRLYPEEASLNVSLRLSGNYSLRQDQQDAIEVILQKKTGDDTWEEVERHPSTDFSYGSLIFETGSAGHPFESGATYRVIQENERPWDLDNSVILYTTHYLIIGSGDSVNSPDPIEFTVDESTMGSSFNVVINNEYDEPRLTLTKMDTLTGETLPGAEFTVKKVVDDTVVTSYTTDESGIVDIIGGSAFESETLYYVTETHAPEGYLLPLNPEKIYFYFCNDPFLEPSILEDLPEGEKAVNLSETFDALSIDNQKKELTIPVMKTWQGNAWPSNVGSVTIGLYQSVDGAEPERVLDEGGEPQTVVLTKTAPYNNNAFTNLPARDDEDRPITYSIVEESVTSSGGSELLADYVQEYGISDSGVYIVRNKLATTLTVTKEWYDPTTNQKVTSAEELAKQPTVYFDVYRTTGEISDDARADGITNTEMADFIADLTKVRSRVRFGEDDGWTTSITDLDKYADSGAAYHYYAYEIVPSFGDELYEVDEEQGTVLIKNKTMPETVTVTVSKAALVNDPRPESSDTDFSFTLSLKKGDYAIRRYQVSSGTTSITTDWSGNATFTLKPAGSVDLTLPVGVTATITEAVNPEYVEVATGTGVTDLDDEERVFEFDVDQSAEGAAITFTNTLRVICKVVDINDEQHPYESLKSALAHVRENPSLYGDTVTIQMLEDYTMPATDVFDVRPGEDIVLTTASTTDPDFPFRTERTEQTDTAIITRGGDSGSMLTNEGTLTLGKITLDGAGTEVTTDGGIVHTTGTLNMTDGATLQNASVDGMGGAIYSTGTINMPGGTIDGNSATKGSAIYLAAGTLNMTGGQIENNISADDGAVAAYSTRVSINLSGDPLIFDNTNTAGEWSNIYLEADSDQVITVLAPGLDATDRLIGVRAAESHREIGEQFATAEYGMTENLNRFVNDIYEYRGKLKEGTSTNVVWDGLSLTINKVVAPTGANANDRFTLTLSSTSIKRSTYTIDGTVDYEVTPAKPQQPGTIVFENVQDGDSITVSPLPFGSYTIEEASSNYSPTYSGQDASSGSITFDDGSFSLSGDSSVTLTNTRRLADVTLTKTVQDRLKAADEVQDFEFTVGLIDADGTPLAGFELAEGITTSQDGTATLTMSPSENQSAVKALQAPVGATMSIAEANDPNYTVTTTAQDGTGAEIADEDADENVFAFTVTDGDADIAFSNERKMAEVQLRKNLFNKVSATESFTFTVTLQDGDGHPVAGYLLYKDAQDAENDITTDAEGKATVMFDITGEGSDALTMAKTLTIPEGTRLEVAETPVTKNILGTEREIYTTTYSVNEGQPATGTTATIPVVSDDDHSIVFSNTRKTQTIVVTNTVNGYSGNVVPFTYTATVTDGGDNDYDVNGFEDGQMTFELTTGQSQTLTIPYGATLTVAEGFVVGYETTVKTGSAAAVTALSTEFVVTQDLPTSSPLAFTNSQLIGLRIVNNTSSTLTNVQVYVGYGTRMYRVNDSGDGQDRVTQTSGRWATLSSIEAGKTAILEIQHQNDVTYSQDYTVKGVTPTEGYYYTITNEPSFHEYANPAILHVYDAANYEVKGKLRYSVEDSTVTFTQQPLVSFDANGGSWTTEMDGYRDRDGDRKVYQKAVTTSKAVDEPTPDPVYPTAEDVAFLGWTANEAFARAAHTASDDVSAQLYDFATPVTGPMTLYAIWARDPSVRVVTVKNGLNETLTINVELTNSDASAAAGHVLYEDAEHPENTITTDGEGKASFNLAAGATQNLTVPQGAKLVVTTSKGTAYSIDFTDADSVAGSFTINSVTNDGTVSFIGGICKITDASGAVLYDNSGNPAVYTTLAAAFTAYTGNLYAEPEKQTSVTPAAVKMLIDEYVISETVPIAFPNATMTFTTAGASDEDFPYVGTRDRSAIYRSTAGANSQCFTLSSGTITLTEIVLDGGSERGVKVARTLNGGLISMNNASGTLNVETGTTLRNCQFAGYDNSDGSRGGAIYATNGTLNVKAGLFSNLHARRGAAICTTSSAALNVAVDANSNDTIRFADCSTSASSDANLGGDGGAICYESTTKDLLIDGGEDKDNPRIFFDNCVAGSNYGDGGAIFATTGDSYTNSVTVKGCSFRECSAKNNSNSSTGGYGGGAISAYKVKDLTVTACEFEDCDTLCCGGAIVTFVNYVTAADNETVVISDCTFTGCNCKAQGGAVAAYQSSTSASSSATRIHILNSHFSECSSGTNNGSGGAIQCYLPCMKFEDSHFTDCWAGKEGGAVNNFFGGSYVEVWSKSKTEVINCHFTRCRAEDRYDTTALQHYGGAINTKAKAVTVTDSYFEECVSTLREGGALHIGGQGDGSKATITGSTFKNCTAKNGGGALLSSHETLEIDGCFFYGCGSSAKNGGAVYHYRNSRGDSTQKTINIKNSTFGADPGVAEAEGCNAAQNGGAIWTRATTDVTLENLTIENCIAAGNGGGVYLETTVTTATVAGGTISGCQAQRGSAVYVGKAGATATFSGNLYVHDNSVSNIDDGAIHGGKLYFEGNVRVEENTCSSDPTYNHDVLMQNDNVTTIYTTETGLGSGAHIGVYVPDQYFNKRGLEGKAFGTYSGSAYLDSFFNDRNSELFGYQLAVGDTNIYWGIYVCKITDANGNTLTRPNGRDAIYQKLTMAFGEFTSVTGGEPVYVKMLVEEYNIKQTGVINNFPAADVTLTTASRSDEKHPYRGTEGTVCTISRGTSDTGTNRLFNLNTAGATFQLQDITLDGRKDKTKTRGDYGLIQASSGNALIINSGTTLQYCYASSKGNGAAIYSNGVPVTVNGAYDADKKEATVKFVNCEVLNDSTSGSGNNNGGAIHVINSTLTIKNEVSVQGEYGTEFIACSSRRGGAIYTTGSTMSVEDALFQDCFSASQGGAIYHNNNNATTTISNSAFRTCYTVGSDQYSYGGAVGTNALTLTVDGCEFANCYAKSSGGAINHGLETNNRTKTSITNTTFDGCYTTGTNTSYAHGGSVYTQAKEVVITNSNFNNSTSTNYGGALYCQNNAGSPGVTITGSRFENCSSTRTSGGYGGAIYCVSKKLVIGTTTITHCIATGNASKSGAIYMETSGSALNVNDGTVISNCYANRGAAIYLKNGVTMTLDGSPEFTHNGYTRLNETVVNAEKGACIYLEEGSKINLSGSPKFSRNNITNQGTNAQDRVANGGTTDYVRQDLYLAGYSGTNAASINITGELTGGTIWVWPEQSPHRRPGEQFAIMVTSPTISDATLQMMRNALSDNDTSCSSGEYLAGVRISGDTRNVYWDKMYSISFMKKDNKGVPIPGAEFTLYKDSACTVVATRARSANGTSDTNAQGELLDMGEVNFTTVPIGAYYMKETVVPESFRADDVTYIVLVGSPSLHPTEYNRDIWEGNGPLNVDGAATIVERLTVHAGKYYGIFLLRSDGKADLSKNIVAANVGIINTRRDFEAWFMKTDATGAPLPNATFTLYEPILDNQQQPVLNQYDYPQMVRWHRDGEDYPEPVTSADGTNAYKKANGSTVPKGVVYFRELPIGTYYLVETAYPIRNGNNRLTYFVEGDRVFQLDIPGTDADDDGMGDFELSEWDAENQAFEPCRTAGSNYVVENQEAVCKLTDDGGNLLYEPSKLGLDGMDTYHPAIYPTLEEGFAAAQEHGLYSGAGATKALIGNDANNPLKLQVLRDFALSSPVTYSGARGLTFTTASRTSTSVTDRYVFTTTRTSDTSRAEVKRAYNADASADANNVALITVADGASLTLQNINLNGQKSSFNGRALHVTDGGRLFILDNAQVHKFKQQGDTADETVRGGAILMDDNTSLYIDGGARAHSAVMSDNEVAGDGGAIAIGEGCYVDIKNAQLLGNTADGKGGAVYVASGVSVPLAQGTLRGNTAALGSAFYLEEGTEEHPTTLTVRDGTMTANKASGANGGAINAGGPHAVIAFEGSPVVFNNTSTPNSAEQRNVVLSEDSNGIIQTTQAGLSGGLIGVYVPGEISGDLFQGHGLMGKPFGAFGEGRGDRNLNIFRNDRNLALYGTKNSEDGTIDWIHVVCKLTDANDNLLYQDEVFTINGTTVRCKAPAVYPTLQEGFDAVPGMLYAYNGTAFGDTSDLKLKMLQDLDLLTGVRSTATNRATVFTTAETQVSSGMNANGDYFVFETTRTVGDDPATTALIARDYSGASLVTATGKSLTLRDIVLDGAKGSDMRATTDGGLVRLAAGQLVIADGAVLENSRTSGNGGAVYAASGTTVTVEGGTINHNECTASGNGAGIYLDGATIRLSGNPDFGGKGVDDNGEIIDQSVDPQAGGNWKQGSVAGDDLTNGTKAYGQYRQDIYVRGMAGSPVTNIVLAGNVGYTATGEFDAGNEGSIWTWIEDVDPTHHKDQDQFAVVATGATVSETSYTVFRNARDDDATGNSTDKYLTGIAGDAIGDRTCVYWGPSVRGSRRVILRKVTTSDNTTFQSLAGATFTVYSGNSVTRVDNVELKDLTSNASGIFWVGDLPYGTYYLHETAPSEKWFTLTISDDTVEGSYDGVVMSAAQTDDPRVSA